MHSMFILYRLLQSVALIIYLNYIFTELNLYMEFRAVTITITIVCTPVDHVVRFIFVFAKFRAINALRRPCLNVIL